MRPIKPITVADLIQFLQTKPPALPVAYRKHSEQLLLELDDIATEALCEPRTDGWIHDARPDKPTRDYLVFPGN